MGVKVFIFFKLGAQALAGVAQWIERWTAKPKGRRFDSQSGHMPGLWARPQ